MKNKISVLFIVMIMIACLVGCSNVELPAPASEAAEEPFEDDEEELEEDFEDEDDEDFEDEDEEDSDEDDDEDWDEDDEDFEDEDEDWDEDDEDFEDEDWDEDENEDGDRDESQGKTKSSKGIKSVDDGDPSETALTGLKRDVLQSGEVQYAKPGLLAANTWVEDKGTYYFIGPDGCLVYNNYAPDGYWADKKGAWDKSVKRQELQFEPYNNDYIGNLWTFEITMDDAYKGKGKIYYTGMSGKKRDIGIDRLGISSYVAYVADNPEELYMLTVVDDGESIIASSDGSTDKCTIR